MLSPTCLREKHYQTRAELNLDHQNILFWAKILTHTVILRVAVQLTLFIPTLDTTTKFVMMKI